MTGLYDFIVLKRKCVGGHKYTLIDAEFYDVIDRFKVNEDGLVYASLQRKTEFNLLENWEGYVGDSDCADCLYSLLVEIAIDHIAIMKGAPK